MLAKIMPKVNGNSFNAVGYNSRKMNEGKGELMDIQNFPTLSLKDIPNQQVVKNYLRACSSTNRRVKQPQFHAMISAKEREYNKYQLTEAAKIYMEKMGYGKQPYIVVFHTDTDNNHVHIVSTRVTKEGKKINDSFENVRSQKVMQDILNEKYNISESEKLKKLLSYKCSSFEQYKILLEKNSFRIRHKDDKYNIYKGGVLIQSVNKLPFTQADQKEKNVLKAKLSSYSNTYDTTLKSYKGSWRSEATEKLKQSLGIEIVFHHKDDKSPFGYTIIDHANQTVYKGSEVLKLKDFLSPVEQYENQEEIKQPEAEPGEQVTELQTGNKINIPEKENQTPDLSRLFQLFDSGGHNGGDDEQEQKQHNSNRKKLKRRRR